MKITIGDVDYEVHPDIMDLLNGEGVRYLDGDEKDGVHITFVRTLKKSDDDFEDVFVSIYETTFGEELLKNAIDFEGVNDTLPDKG